jgi:hydroxymethylglutaryl-CoA lyase
MSPTVEDNRIEIVEVGPRDGLQNEPHPVSTADKIALIDALAAAGARRIEVASFVSPKRVPQMADAEAVLAGLRQRPEVTYVGLALNTRGAERAIAAGVGEVGGVVSASDSFGIRNQGQSTLESLAVVSEMAGLCRDQGVSFQASISMAFGCPFEGAVDPAKVVDLAKRLGDLPLRELGVADTIGVGTPSQVADLFGLIGAAVPHLPLRAHFHDTRNTGVANVWAAVQSGVRTIDASIAGLGGCPFAPGATGNVATEDVVWMLERSGFRTGLNLSALIDLARQLGASLERTSMSALARAGAPALAEQ